MIYRPLDDENQPRRPLDMYDPNADGSPAKKEQEQVFQNLGAASYPSWKADHRFSYAGDFQNHGASFPGWPTDPGFSYAGNFQNHGESYPGLRVNLESASYRSSWGVNPGCSYAPEDGFIFTGEINALIKYIMSLGSYTSGKKQYDHPS